MTELFGGKKPDVSVLLTCPPATRIERFAAREDCGIQEASDRLLERDQRDLARFNARYGIAHIDPSDFHLVLNSGLLGRELLPEIAFRAISHIVGDLNPV